MTWQANTCMHLSWAQIGHSDRPGLSVGAVGDQIWPSGTAGCRHSTTTTPPALPLPAACFHPRASSRGDPCLLQHTQVLATEDDLALDWEQSVDDEGHSLMVCGRRSLWAAEHVERAMHIGSHLHALDEKLQGMRERDADCEFGVVLHLHLRCAQSSMGMAGRKAVKLLGRGTHKHIIVAILECNGPCAQLRNSLDSACMQCFALGLQDRQDSNVHHRLRPCLRVAARSATGLYSARFRAADQWELDDKLSAFGQSVLCLCFDVCLGMPVSSLSAFCSGDHTRKVAVLVAMPAEVACDSPLQPVCQTTGCQLLCACSSRL